MIKLNTLPYDKKETSNIPLCDTTMYDGTGINEHKAISRIFATPPYVFFGLKPYKSLPNPTLHARRFFKGATSGYLCFFGYFWTAGAFKIVWMGNFKVRLVSEARNS